MEVTALTYDDPEHDAPPRPVTGELKTRYVPTLDYYQYWVGGEQVDPSTLPPEYLVTPTPSPRETSG